MSVWRIQAPSRVAFFAWSAALGKILTLDNLRKRHVIVMDRCCICKKNGKSVDHLRLHFDVASAIWSSLFNRFGMSWGCLDVSLICMIVGGPLVGHGALRFGKWCLRAYFGVYGRK